MAKVYKFKKHNLFRTSNIEQAIEDLNKEQTVKSLSLSANIDEALAILDREKRVELWQGSTKSQSLSWTTTIAEALEALDHDKRFRVGNREI